MKRLSILLVVGSCYDDVAPLEATSSSGATAVTLTSDMPQSTSAADTSVDSSSDLSTSGATSEPHSSSGSSGDVPFAGFCDGYRNSFDRSIFVYSQAEVDAVAGVSCIIGGLVVYGDNGDDVVSDLGAFASLETVSEHIALNGLMLEELQGFESLQWIGGDLVVGSLSPGIPGCHENPNLTNLDALANLQHFDTLLLCGDLQDSLASIDGLDTALEGAIAGHVELTDLSALSDLTAFDGVTAIDGGLALLDLPLVTDLSGLNDLADVAAITISRTSVADLYGLESLVDVDDRLGITSNEQLQTLAGLDAIVSVGALYVMNNPALPQSEAEVFASSIDVANETVICGNLDGPAC
jgi:hypothetical protein